MKRHAGFTLIELLITLTVMVVLVVLAVVSLRSTQANARDEERKTDVENIARGLEQRYINGNRMITAPAYVQRGSYPGVNEMLHGMGQSQAGFDPAQIVGGYLTELMPDTSPANFIPPGNGTFVLSCTSACQPAETQSVIDAATTISTYVYEPIDKSGNVCGLGDCVRFNLYYRTEKDNIVHKVTSKNQ
jgi:prepilin-type N-terminal cleavage/methylation domain-containing protein